MSIRMKVHSNKLVAFAILVRALAAYAETPRTATPCDQCLRDHLSVLAGDALRGREAGTVDELKADQYVAAKLRSYGIAPVGSSYVHPVVASTTVVCDFPILRITSELQTPIILVDQLRVLALSKRSIHGPIFRISGTAPVAAVPKGSFVLLDRDPSADADIRYRRLISAVDSGAAAVILRAPEGFETLWNQPLAGTCAIRQFDQLNSRRSDVAVLVLSSSAFSRLWGLRHPIATLSARVEERVTKTWNVLGELRGSQMSGRSEVVVLSAHVDHLGTKDNGNIIYHGADDDASGVAVVLELSRIFSRAPRARRKIMFAFFGGEEVGLLGSIDFVKHAPLPLGQIVADIEFEMVGRRDKVIGADTVWLTGWNKSNLGPVLQAHGAKIAADPYPLQNFFQRSDNYAFAMAGVVAHTVSSFSLHSDYHEPTDEISAIEFDHIKDVVQTMGPAVQWLANSSFRPDWVTKKTERPLLPRD
jgi:aminopeptidase YwaD